MVRLNLKHWLMPASLVLVFLSSVLLTAAQGASEEVWIDYKPGWNISEKTRFNLDSGLRKKLEDQGYLRLVLSPSADIRVNEFKISMGVANYLTLNEVISDRWEIRPYQSASVVWPKRRVSLDHRVRLEERFDINTDSWDSQNSLRGRYRLRLRFRLAAHQADQFWALTASGELFYTLAGNEGQFQEQTRAGLGVERTFKHGRRLRFETTWQQQGLIYDPDNSADVIYFRFGWLRSW
jgi:hypothetical protein